MSASLRALPLLVAAGLTACSGRIGAPAGGGASGAGGALGGGGAGSSVEAGAAGRPANGGDASAGNAGMSASSSGSGGANAGGGLGGAAGGGTSGAAGGGTGGAAGGGTGGASLQADAPLTALEGSGVTGTAQFVETGDKVVLSITLTGCPAGPHAVHLHANPACDDNGNAAGGHWSPQGEGIGDVICGADGAAQFSFTPAPGAWTIGGAAATDLLPHAVMLHAGPSLDPGARIACGIPAKIPGV